MGKKTQRQQPEHRDACTPPAQGIWVGEGALGGLLRSLLLAILFAWALMNLGAVLGLLKKALGLFSPFLMGGGIAFLMNVILQPLERTWQRLGLRQGRRLMRPVCLSLTALTVLGLLFAVVFMMIPSLRQSGGEFIRSIPKYVREMDRWWSQTADLAAKYGVVFPEYAIDPDLLTEKIADFIDHEGSGLITVTWGAATSLFSGLMNMLLAFIFALYLLAKKEAAAAHLKRLAEVVLSPRRARQVLDIAALSNKTFASFVSGQLTEAVIIGVLCLAGMLMLRLPYAGAVSTFVGVTALIPVFGAWLGGGLGALLILLADPAKAALFVVFLLVLQQVEGNLIYPKVVGKSVGLPGILVLVAVTVGGEAFGIFGMLVGVPVCAAAYSLYLQFLDRRT